ncbi:Holliday junction resolvase RuvX [Flavimarina sp. Hel_I_48]|uniref:Holliday junction resolvase RuvX n=1 Tax=Flavimarina sp. Hel_I_48 TaxID=1392488 RepID=UPI0004DF2EC7|nr:Holliday junction resolvase RuvX [Flavimarina sp. Hel_I_48]
MARILAIDYGTKRTGIAVTDELQLIASGLTTVKTDDLLSFLKEYCEKEDVERILIGEPKRMNNEASAVEEHILKFCENLEKVIVIPITRVDERFTSKLAVESMIKSGLKKKKRQDKALVDEISATIILQTYLYK